MAETTDWQAIASALCPAHAKLAEENRCLRIDLVNYRIAFGSARENLAAVCEVLEHYENAMVPAAAKALSSAVAGGGPVPGSSNRSERIDSPH